MSQCATIDTVQQITTAVAGIVRGQTKTIRYLLAALISGGHVLLEDFPGTGKTTLAKALAFSIGARFTRVQFTPDLLPSDIIGISVLHQQDHTFRFRPGPVFTNILLADEINRASPRTQSALLEAMAENQVTVDGVSHPLDALFFVIATQNPVEFRGTYPLPEAQMDRFAMQLTLGYLDPEEEVALLRERSRPRTIAQEKISAQEVLVLREAAAAVPVSPEIQRYIVDLVRATRSYAGVVLGGSPRASLMMMKAAQALALIDNTGFVMPEQIQELAVPMIGHRLTLAPQARFAGTSPTMVVEDILKSTPVPR
jgi:MoxR-like ATPase